MKPAPFTYHRPTTLAEALELLERHGEEAKILAGGQSLVPVMNFRLATPERLIDINRVPELCGCRIGDGTVRLGALTRHRELLSLEDLRTAAPLLPMIAPSIGHPQIRCSGTFGGSLSHADPSAELPGAVLALDATMVISSSRGERRVPAREFFLSYFTTVLEPDEILTAVEFPACGPGEGAAFREVAARQGDFALAGAAAVVTVAEDDVITDARLAAISVSDVPVRLTEAEKVLRGQTPTPDILTELRSAVQDVLEPTAAAKASAAYKKRTTAALAARVAEQAWRTAQRRTA
ncbi:xanthine dehydrogenase family protein subunit M [Amycolatopsis acidiphila]|uniref:Xanthine dehydrogenase family protein subunit M n=1 Tax=Amycolatopsis acidiphila TaxID=715473 RepID=A0A558A8A9_9PSEU|nr:xanthine dehydrogenase family protein subunit M [Amycolatopsis acidiphila]TVT20500.1 xanthine dehydrogenase family protein subunit M [Amycolatopsis acidiphila]UIJ57025.1 xanthine dehydrogenase family protein subunit M [Amycolatopsis acidiphila]GHG53779.1 carbon monoxide dehydrogenase [Amycolatopsis acidiphila]